MKRRDFNRTLVAATGAMLLSDLSASGVVAARDSGEPAQISTAARRAPSQEWMSAVARQAHAKQICSTRSTRYSKSMA